jgi:hypothetical protein
LKREKKPTMPKNPVTAGQVKALSMIIAIEGLIPDRRLSPSAPPPVEPPFYVAEWRRRQEQAEDTQPPDAVTAAEAQPDAPQAPEPEPSPKPASHAPAPNLDRNHPSPASPLIHPERLSWVPAATGCTFDALLDASGPLRLPISSRRRPFAHGR